MNTIEDQTCKLRHEDLDNYMYCGSLLITYPENTHSDGCKRTSELFKLLDTQHREYNNLCLCTLNKLYTCIKQNTIQYVGKYYESMRDRHTLCCYRQTCCGPCINSYDISAMAKLLASSDDMCGCNGTSYGIYWDSDNMRVFIEISNLYNNGIMNISQTQEMYLYNHIPTFREVIDMNLQYDSALIHEPGKDLDLQITSDAICNSEFVIEIDRD